jgi:CRP/FNR family transcriptional regulator, cyclic AMP receptor protein
VERQAAVHDTAKAPLVPAPFLDRLTPDEMRDLRRCGWPRRWPRGAVLCVEGEVAQWVAALFSGIVMASRFTADGREVVLGIQGPGTLVGDVEAADGRPRHATARALAPVTALVIPRADFAGFLRAHHGAACLLLRELCERLRDADDKRAEYGTCDAVRRVAHRLAELAARFGEPVDGGVRISVAITQDELASWAGASREAASKALRTLRLRGWIETGRRSVLIRDPAALDRLNGDRWPVPHLESPASANGQAPMP